MRKIICALALFTATLAMTGFAHAQNPSTNTQGTNAPAANAPAAQAQQQYAYLLKGHESLSPGADLIFVVRQNGVLMVDASATAPHGTVSFTGNRLTLTFGNCVYEGDVVNGVYSGTARVTSGAQAGQSWTFNVRNLGCI